MSRQKNKNQVIAYLSKTQKYKEIAIDSCDELISKIEGLKEQDNPKNRR